MYNLLLVEDDESLGFLLKENLEMKGYTTTLCRDGDEGWKLFLEGMYDLCIIDIMLPKKDGYTLARQIRERNQEVPLIFLTAKSQETDILKGFETGCDDYITKPFSAQELYYRIKAVLKRVTAREGTIKPQSLQQTFTFGDLFFDPVNRLVRMGAEERKLSTKENELLKVFAGNPNIPLNRSVILTIVWGDDNYFASKSMDVYLSRLRKILSFYPGVEIQNIHGSGFRFIVKQQLA